GVPGGPPPPPWPPAAPAPAPVVPVAPGPDAAAVPVEAPAPAAVDAVPTDPCPPDANPRPLEPALRLLDDPLPARGTAIQTTRARTVARAQTAPACLPGEARRHHRRNSRNGVVAATPSMAVLLR